MTLLSVSFGIEDFRNTGFHYSSAPIPQFGQKHTTQGLGPAKRQPEAVTRTGNQKRQPEAAKSREEENFSRRSKLS